MSTHFTDSERTMLLFALNEAQEAVWSRDGFTDDDQAAIDSLRAMANGGAQPGAIIVEMTREDAQELARTLMADRYRMDRGDGSEVPQPRWGANVRVAEAVAAALDSTPEG